MENDEFATLFKLLSSLAAKNKQNKQEDEPVVTHISLLPTPVEQKKPAKKKEPVRVIELPIAPIVPKVPEAPIAPQRPPSPPVVILAPIAEKGSFDCRACGKKCVSEGTLIVHYDRNLACRKWALRGAEEQEVPKKPVHLYLDDCLKKAVTGDVDLQCKFCKSVFVNTGNHHKHFYTATACNRLAYLEIKKIIAM